jgi:chorismate mutase/prephenate dehydratase
MNLDQLRNEIDLIDDKILELFAARMGISGAIAEFKAKSNMPVRDSHRERQKLLDISEKAGSGLSSYAVILYSLIMELSRSYQERLLNPSCELKEKILSAIEATDKLFTQQAVVACQGIEGAYSQLACEKFFKLPNIMYFTTWDGVFSAIENGLCRYGVLPLENSTAGTVNRIYDLMMRYNFSIVRSVRLKVDHNLLAKKGSSISEIREIYSHEQAFNQCAEFIKTLGTIKITVCENTAVAARMVAQSDRNDVAAISSSHCAAIYGLSNIASSIQDQDNNYTRFICISKKLEIYPGADKTSIMMILPHKPGSLYRVLACFYALGINLVKLESRPLPSREFEFMFYFDLETSVYSNEYAELMCRLSALCEEFKYLGSYSEIV